jgi:murein DD-endopeptidase MepM/ murein hydrolase activator NlpD
MKVTRKDAEGRLVTRWESVRAPKDKVYAVLDGVVVVASTNPAKSGYGKYVIIEHAWSDGSRFCTLYAHLSSVSVRENQRVSQGTPIGVMGQTARDAASRIYLRANPHMHFEVGRLIHGDPVYSNRYDPRNLQPYHPIDFFQRYGAISRSEWAAAQRKGSPMLATVGPR